MLRTRKIVNGARCLVLLAAAGSAYPASLSNADKEFLITAARTHMIETYKGQLAEKQASQPAVKDLGNTLVQDHTQSYQQLTVLAAQTGISIPKDKDIDAEKDQTIAELAHLKGAPFDHQFAAYEIADEQRAISVFNQEAEHGKNADVKAYAAKIVPVLQKHLQLARKCAIAETYNRALDEAFHAGHDD
jgi:putative membrane protein